MNYEAFGRAIELEVQKHLDENTRAELHSVTKNNGVHLTGLCITERDSRISPTIYLEEFYQRYLNGCPVLEIVAKILEIYEKSRSESEFSMDYFTDFSKVQNQLMCKLVSRERNQKLLKEIPHVPYLNLEIVFFLAVENMDFGSGSILIRNEHLKAWKVSREILYEYARENTIRERPFRLQSMKDLIGNLVKEEEQHFFAELPLYVLSNEERIYGAAAILYDRVLEEAGKRLKENYYILPSSLHEVILVPESGMKGREPLEKLVREVNETQVEPEDVLADSVYHYDCERHKLSM